MAKTVTSKTHLLAKAMEATRMVCGDPRETGVPCTMRDGGSRNLGQEKRHMKIQGRGFCPAPFVAVYCPGRWAIYHGGLQESDDHGIIIGAVCVNRYTISNSTPERVMKRPGR